MMGVYVDDAHALLYGMVMCNMIADTSEELHAMADQIGMARRWVQQPGTPREHYDISLSKRALAIKHGAVPISRRQLARMTRRRTLESEEGDGGGPGAFAS